MSKPYNPHQQWRPEQTGKPYSIGALVNAFGRTKPDVDRFFDTDGPLARVYPGSYQRRSSQVNLAQMVSRTLSQRLTLMAEAETGTGKSFAMLIPAILWAVANNMTVLVSTATIALQDQYCRKDLPLLVEAFRSEGIHFKWAKAQGRSNYYCLDSKGTDDWEFSSHNEQLHEWLQSTQTGDFNELPFEIKAPRLAKFYEANRADADDCPGQRKCPMGEQCYFYRAKMGHEGAHIIVVNHALLALNDRLDGLVLPAYQALMIDEAHQLEKYVRSAWEAQLSPRRCYKLGAKLEKQGLDGQPLLDQVGKDLDGFFQEYLRTYGDAPSVEFYSRKWPESWADWIEEKDEQLNELVETLMAHAEEIAKAGPLGAGVDQLRIDLLKVTRDDQAARWFERDKKRNPLLKISPVDVSKEMARLYQVPTVLTSATLAIGESYEFAAAEMGVANPLEMPPLKSPFDWDKNCLYVFPRKGTLVEADLKGKHGETTRQTARRWATRIAGPIKALLERTSGRAFVLFTSKAVMEEAYDLVAPWCREWGFDVLIQGEYSKGETVARFKAGCSPVLFATSSFWEGVDVPGSQLSAIIIDKLPFPSPVNPIDKAKANLLGFAGYNVPMVVRALKQGVGRLIRSTEDRGVVCILDPRVHKYARNIIAHLPGQALAALDRTSPVKIGDFLDQRGYRPAEGPLEEWAASGLRHLSAHDGDRAREHNQVGFSASDTHAGNELAQLLAEVGLTDRQWAVATTMLRKYRRQIGNPPEVELELDAIDEEAA